MKTKPKREWTVMAASATAVVSICLSALLFAVITTRHTTATLDLTPTALHVKTPSSPPANQITPVVCTGSVLFMGDTMLARGIGSAIEHGQNPYANVTATLQSAGLRVANIETTLASPGVGTQAAGKAYTFDAPVAGLSALKSADINVSVLANNHTSDYGPAGTTDMLKLFADAHLPTVGAGTSVDAAFAPLISDVSLSCGNSQSFTVKVGIIAANDIENSYTAVSNSRAGSAYFDKPLIQSSIARARSAGAQLVVIIPHWGQEYSAAPTPRQQEWGHWFIDAGADIVIGNHPHVILPTETYKGKCIYYSLGNFIFDGMGSEPRATAGEMVSLPLSQSAYVNSQAGKTPLTTNESLSIGAPQSILYHLNTSGFPVLNN